MADTRPDPNPGESFASYHKRISDIAWLEVYNDWKAMHEERIDYIVSCYYMTFWQKVLDWIKIVTGTHKCRKWGWRWK